MVTPNKTTQKFSEEKTNREELSIRHAKSAHVWSNQWVFRDRKGNKYSNFGVALFGLTTVVKMSRNNLLDNRDVLKTCQKAKLFKDLTSLRLIHISHQNLLFQGCIRRFAKNLTLGKLLNLFSLMTTWLPVSFFLAKCAVPKEPEPRGLISV